MEPSERADSNWCVHCVSAPFDVVPYRLDILSPVTAVVCVKLVIVENSRFEQVSIAGVVDRVFIFVNQVTIDHRNDRRPDVHRQSLVVVRTQTVNSQSRRRHQCDHPTPRVAFFVKQAVVLFMFLFKFQLFVGVRVRTRLNRQLPHVSRLRKGSGSTFLKKLLAGY